MPYRLNPYGNFEYYEPQAPQPANPFQGGQYQGYDPLQMGNAGMLGDQGQIGHIPPGGIRFIPAIDVFPPEMPMYREPDDIAEEAKMKLLNPFLVGCDPEFMAIDDAGDFVNVKLLLPHGGPVGWDHDGRVLELHPTPAKNVYTIVKKIATIFRTTKFPTAKLRAGAFFKENTMGGHVHLDVPANELYNPRIQALDAVTRLLENLDILTKKESSARRAKRWAGWPGTYGQWSDCKIDHGRMEYRTMASWLYSPVTSYLCLTAAKLACAEPKAVMDTLALGKVSNGKLIRLFETFEEKDDDAKRICEKLLEPEIKLQRDPENNLLTVWAKGSSALEHLGIE